MREKKFPSLQFMNRDRMRLLLTPPLKWSVNAFKAEQRPKEGLRRGGVFRALISAFTIVNCGMEKEF
jgi:hypothetical protein